MSEICPCCSSDNITFFLKWVDCGYCSHRWKIKEEFNDKHYQLLNNRNILWTDSFKRKNTERSQFIARFINDNVKNILEVGCAEGFLGEILKSNFAIRYDGVEISQDGLVAEERIDHVFKGGTQQIIDEKYDVIASFHVLEHIRLISSEIKQWYRLIAEEGVVIVEVPNKSGHELLENDNNLEHIHQFSLLSLTIILDREGFDICSVMTGCFESSTYNDSLRVVARKKVTPEQKRQKLLKRFSQKLPSSFNVYGVGGDFLNYISPLMSSLSIDTLLDTSDKQWGRNINGKVVQQFNKAKHCELPILIASIRYKNEIICLLNQLGVPDHLMVTLDEIYESAK